LTKGNKSESEKLSFCQNLLGLVSQANPEQLATVTKFKDLCSKACDLLYDTSLSRVLRIALAEAMQILFQDQNIPKLTSFLETNVINDTELVDTYTKLWLVSSNWDGVLNLRILRQFTQIEWDNECWESVLMMHQLVCMTTKALSAEVVQFEQKVQIYINQGREYLRAKWSQYLQQCPAYWPKLNLKELHSKPAAWSLLALCSEGKLDLS
jgi:hypothetical protein